MLSAGNDGKIVAWGCGGGVQDKINVSIQYFHSLVDILYNRYVAKIAKDA